VRAEGTSGGGARLVAMTHRIGITLLLATTFVVGACSGAGGSATPGPSDEPPGGTAPQGLDGRTFLSTGIAGRALVDGSRVRLTFNGNQIGVHAGCNSMGGTYAVDGGHLVLGQMGTTSMACEDPLMDQDAWLSAFLDGAAIDLVGDTLGLANGGVTLALQDREVADPDRPLAGTRWVLDAIISGEAVSSVPAGVTAALIFEAGRVSVEAGCNRGGGTVEVTDATLAFGPIGLTKMACEPAAMAVEQAMTAVLSGQVGYTIEAGTLTLDAGAAGLMFRAAD